MLLQKDRSLLQSTSFACSPYVSTLEIAETDEHEHKITVSKAIKNLESTLWHTKNLLHVSKVSFAFSKIRGGGVFLLQTQLLAVNIRPVRKLFEHGKFLAF